MKKGLKIAAITVGVIIILIFLLPFAFQGKIADIVKTEGNKMLNAQFDIKFHSDSLHCVPASSFGTHMKNNPSGKVKRLEKRENKKLN